jgi:DNA-binding FrmR family transcriptional regulator
MSAQAEAGWAFGAGWVNLVSDTLTDHTRRLAGIEGKLETIDGRLTAIEDRLKKIDGKMDAILRRLPPENVTGS